MSVGDDIKLFWYGTTRHLPATQTIYILES